MNVVNLLRLILPSLNYRSSYYVINLHVQVELMSNSTYKITMTIVYLCRKNLDLSISYLKLMLSAWKLLKASWSYTIEVKHIFFFNIKESRKRLLENFVFDLDVPKSNSFRDDQMQSCRKPRKSIIFHLITQSWTLALQIVGVWEGRG